MKKGELIFIDIKIDATLEKVWEYWTSEKHIINWNFASEEWHCPKASNNLKVGESFCYTMAAKDGSFSFDFKGEYTEIIPLQTINYNLEDNRKVSICFGEKDGEIVLIESFEAEGSNSDEMQKNGWQSILENFKKYLE